MTSYTSAKEHDTAFHVSFKSFQKMTADCRAFGSNDQVKWKRNREKFQFKPDEKTSIKKLCSSVPSAKMCMSLAYLWIGSSSSFFSVSPFSAGKFKLSFSLASLSSFCIRFLMLWILIGWVRCISSFARATGSFRTFADPSSDTLLGKGWKFKLRCDFNGQLKFRPSTKCPWKN